MWSVYLRDFPEPLGAPGHLTRLFELLVSPPSNPSCSPAGWKERRKLFAFCQCLGEALNHGFGKRTYWSRKWTKRFDHSKTFLTELLKSRGYLTFVVEFNSAVFIMFTYLCTESRERGENELMHRLNMLSAFHISM